MPNTREKLIELIQSAVGGCAEYWAMVIADHLIANGVTVQKWIPVSERLPENDYRKHWKERHYYLVRLQYGQMRTARYGYKKYDWWVDSHDCVLSKEHHTEVTHWMPLPEPPKGEADQ